MTESAYNRETHEIGDEATLLIENLGERLVLHEDLGLITITDTTDAQELGIIADGPNYTITWTTTSRVSGGVDFWYSADGGAEWVEIADAEANDGSYAWAFAVLAQGHYTVRLQMNEDNSVFTERHVEIVA